MNKSPRPTKTMKKAKKTNITINTTSPTCMCVHLVEVGMGYLRMVFDFFYSLVQ